MRERDHIDLAEKIVYLAERPDLRERLGQAARKDAVEKFSWKENARRVVEVCQQLLKKHR
jgi:glycosyltransferase involved in cell wall biosynthesis